MKNDAQIGFRPLTRADLPLMQRWRAQPHVRRWWDADDEPTLELVSERYGRLLDGVEPTRAFVITLANEPVGYIQTYRIADHPAYAAAVQVPEVAAGVDLFIGEPALVHRGLGPLVLETFVREVVFGDPQIESCIVGPEPANAAAIRAYDKAGFRYLKTIQVPGEPAPERLMRRGRQDASRKRAKACA